MTHPAASLLEIESAIDRSAPERRAEILGRVMDLFMLGSNRYSEAEMAVFDTIIVKLAATIEASARVLLALRLAKASNAPIGAVRLLAFDDDIDVAGPVLTHSDRLDDATLVENADSKSQSHLLAIAQRVRLSEIVTDVLVERGNRPVVLTLAQNAGAHLSERGFGELIRRSTTDDGLAVIVGCRADVPTHLLLKLLATASKIVRSRLEAENPRLKKEVHSVVSEVTRRMKADLRATAVGAEGASAAAASLPSGRVDATKFGGMAEGGKLEQIVGALAVKTGMPVDFVHRAVASDRNEAMLLLARAAEMKWKDVKALLLLKAGAAGLSQKDLELGLAQYERLKRDTAVQLLRFHRPASP